MMIQVLSGRHQPPDPVVMGSFSANKQLIHIGALFPRTEQTANVEEGFRDGGGARSILSHHTSFPMRGEEKKTKQTKKNTNHKKQQQHVGEV